MSTSGKSDPALLLPADVERFWSKVDRRGPDDCWLWKASLTGGRPGFQYGQFGVRHPDGTPRKVLNRYAHRIAWMLTRGPIPRDIEVCHDCDVPHCCNPSHLFLGTHSDNVRDASEKGRLAVPRKRTRGFKVELIARYLAGGVTQVELADEYRVSKITVCRWLKGLKEPYSKCGPERLSHGRSISTQPTF